MSTASPPGGIEDRERSDTTGSLANVSPNTTWVRLAQRIPVRLIFDDPLADLRLISGRSATITILNEQGSCLRRERNINAICQGTGRRELSRARLEIFLSSGLKVAKTVEAEDGKKQFGATVMRMTRQKSALNKMPSSTRF